MAKQQSGDMKGAIEDYSKGIEFNPKYAEAYFNRGNSKAALGDLQGALQDFNKAIENNPSFSSVI